MDFEIRWTEPAESDVKAILEYVEERSVVGAESVRAAMMSAVRQLAQFPFTGSIYDRDGSGRTRELVCLSYRLFYRVDESAKCVEILSVWHSARGEPELP